MAFSVTFHDFIYHSILICIGILNKIRTNFGVQDSQCRKHLLRSGCQSNTLGSFLRRNKPICGMVGDKRPGGLEQVPLCYGLLPIGIFAIMFARFHFYLAKLTLASNASAKVHLAPCQSLRFCIRYFELCGFLYFRFFRFVALFAESDTKEI